MMQELLEKILEQLHTGEWGFIDPSGERVGVEDHVGYAIKYLKKRRQTVPKSEEGIIAKFLGLSRCVRYYIENEETGFTVVVPVSPTQLEVMEHIGENQEVLFDIVDTKGDEISSGGGLSKLVYQLRAMNLLEQVNMDESSIDFPREKLDLSIWDYEEGLYTLKPEVRNKIDGFIKQYKDKDLLAIAEEIRVVGSIATNQYLDDCDIDVHIVPENMKEWSEEEVKQVVDWFNEHRDELNGYVEKHPIEIYIQLVPNQDLMSDGAYNVLEDEWLVGPKIVSMGIDPYEDFSHIADDIRDAVENADVLLGELKRDVIDYDVIKQAMDRMSGKDKERLLKKLLDKLNEIEDDIEKLYSKRKEWVDARHDAAKPTTPEQALKDVGLAKKWRDTNATFKFVNRYHYLKTISTLKKLLADEEISHAEVPIIKDIMGV